MSVPRAKHALRMMREHVAQGEMQEAALWSLVYLAESRATDAFINMMERLEAVEHDADDDEYGT